MPVYDVRLNHPLRPGFQSTRDLTPDFEPFPRFAGMPGRLLDANGVLIPWAIRCNTETGYVERYERVDDRFVIDQATMRLLIVQSIYAAPLCYAPPKPICEPITDKNGKMVDAVFTGFEPTCSAETVCAIEDKR